MDVSAQGLIELAGHEGVCLDWYYDSVGVPTIGVGYTKSDGLDPRALAPLKDIDVAFDLFRATIKKYVSAVNRALQVEVTQPQFDALVSICYNIGTGGMKNSTFIKRINSGAKIGQLLGFNSVEASLNLDGRTDPLQEHSEDVSMGFSSPSIADAILMWNKPPEILGRRKKEAKLFVSGIYSNRDKVLLFPVNTSHKPVYGKGKEIDVSDLLHM